MSKISKYILIFSLLLIFLLLTYFLNNSKTNAKEFIITCISLKKEICFKINSKQQILLNESSAKTDEDRKKITTLNKTLITKINNTIKQSLITIDFNNQKTKNIKQIENKLLIDLQQSYINKYYNIESITISFDNLKFDTSKPIFFINPKLQKIRV
jgi:hypothetical protein